MIKAAKSFGYEITMSDLDLMTYMNGLEYAAGVSMTGA